MNYSHLSSDLCSKREMTVNKLIVLVLVNSDGTVICLCVCVCVGCRGGGGQRKRLYSAVPGRVFVATRSHSAHGEREISFSKGDKVKGQMIFLIMSFSSSQYV